jgi:hypothetical protein
MPKYTIDHLREHLFETLKGLRDPDKPMELERAKAVADVARVVVDTAKAEVAFLDATGAVASTGFMPDREAPALPGRTRPS